MTQSLNDDSSKLYGKITNPVPVPQKNIGVDLNKQFYDNILAAVEISSLDMAKLQSFNQVSQSRETVYELLDTMSEDSTIAAVLETYTEDATEANDKGDIVWCESSDNNISDYVTYLLNTMDINKHIYQWTYSLIKYGDLYVRLYRNSDVDKDFKMSIEKEEKQDLNENINLNIYRKNDKYVHYVEMVPNPAEMFELTRYGKTYAYVKAATNNTNNKNVFDSTSFQYNFKRNDIDMFDATSFVHASLEDNSSRTPEEVNIYINENLDDDAKLAYTVKRGQSLLYNSFKIWREMMLLQNSLLLNRITKSSIIRIIGVEVGDMPKEQVGPHLASIKSLIEQKSAINTDNQMSEYTNPGPIENNIYVPTHNGIGNISTQTVGGDVDVKSLADIDYFSNKLFGALKVPKQFFGETDDAAGFNGGTSLSIISSRYAKTIKRIQSEMIQLITDIVNLFLVDKNLDTYINKFTIKMLPPTTQEDIDRKDNSSTKIGIIRDVMDLIADVPEASAKIKILKTLLTDVVNNSEVIDIIQEQIEKLESQEEIENFDPDEMSEKDDGHNENDLRVPARSPSMKDFSDNSIDNKINNTSEINNEPKIDNEIENNSKETIKPVNDGTTLPTPAELNAGDFTEMQ